MAEFSDLQGDIILDIQGCEKGSGEIIIVTYSGYKYRLYHEQDCCESVYVEDVCGDINDIIGQRVEVAEERVGDSKYDNDSYESCTWTFYTLRTIKGSLDIRWVGSSNGYYSEAVDFERIGEH
jgi:hypothetical protein